mgnify:CR=1 FL=1
MVEIFSYTLENKTYDVVLTRKRMKTIQYRFKDGKFVISAPRLATKSTIFAGLQKFAPKLIKRTVSIQAITDEYVYIFGEKHLINKDNSENEPKNKELLLKELSNILLDYLKERVTFYSSEMEIFEDYKVKVRNTKTRLGSNSRRTKTLAFALSLVHFSKEIIDSVVVHELAHCKVFDHSKEFYNVVYQHCPNYNVSRKKLIHSEFN